MKKTLFLIFSLLLSLSAGAQISRWVIRPQYDNLRIAQGAPIILGDSLGNTIMWNMEAKRLAMTKDSILPFVEDMGVTIAKGTDKVTGFFTTEGKFYRLDDCRVAHDMPYFSDGYLLLQGSYGYRIINKKGKDAIQGYYDAIYPFKNGFSACMTYENAEKKKNPYFIYLTTVERNIEFKYGKKTFDPEDVQFLSSIGDNGMGIAVIKDKVYHFNSNTLELTPVLPTLDEKNLKRQVEVIERDDQFLIDMQDSIIIRAKSNKSQHVRFHFNPRLVLTKIVYADREETFEEGSALETVYPSSMQAVKGEKGKWGVEYKGTTVLPAQFDSVAFCLNDYAAVCSRGKWGMLYYDQSLKYRLIMNNGNKIPFRHKNFSTKVKLELPSSVSAYDCTFNIDLKYGCNIDKRSMVRKDTEWGNYIEYNCVLTIPDSLPDVVTDIHYPVEITYDDIELPTVDLKTKAWHYKYINVNLDKSETTISKGDVSFTISISAEKLMGDSDYPFEVKIETDSLRSELIKISETRYKCNMYALAEGVNFVNISIHEEGCPPSVFPFEITYIKPKQKTKNAPAVVEDVIIEKKVYVPVVIPASDEEEKKKDEGGDDVKDNQDDDTSSGEQVIEI